MIRRWRLWLSLFLLLLLGGLLLVPQVRWPIHGWLRGEAFYHGMPTSYWSREIQRWKGSGGYSGPACGNQPLQRLTWADELKQYFGFATYRMPEVLDTPPLALPVLRELTEDARPEVRSCAVRAIQDLRRLAQLKAIDLDPSTIP